jgi:hypothetical protein
MCDEELVMLASVAAHVPPRRDHRVRDRVQRRLTHDITCAMSQNTLELHPAKEIVKRRAAIDTRTAEAHNGHGFG